MSDSNTTSKTGGEIGEKFEKKYKSVLVDLPVYNFHNIKTYRAL
jgi:hypothetical protein